MKNAFYSSTWFRKISQPTALFYNITSEQFYTLNTHQIIESTFTKSGIYLYIYLSSFKVGSQGVKNHKLINTNETLKKSNKTFKIGYYLIYLQIPEAAFERCSKEKVIWKYAANLQENTHVEAWFQQSCFEKGPKYVSGCCSKNLSTVRVKLIIFSEAAGLL